MRSLWKGAISFGLVTIPVKLYAATERKDVKFNYLHERCGTPVRYQKVCPTCDAEVPMEEIVRGYEYEKGQYVVLRDEDFEAIPVAATRALEIVDFIHLDEIDPIYYDRTYYLEPGEGGAKAYHLLKQAMLETGRVAIARVVIRSKETLAAIRVYEGGVLCLETMYYPDEIRPVAGLAGIERVPELTSQELEMATGLIESLASPFSPEKFENQYRQALLDLIGQKVAGREVVEAEAPQPGKVIDLMEALRASLRAADEVRAAEGGGGAVAPAAGRRSARRTAPEAPGAAAAPVAPVAPRSRPRTGAS